jgi:hypothetical protein
VQIAFLHYRPLLPTPVHREPHQRLARLMRDFDGDVLVSGLSSATFMNGKRFWGDPVIMGDLERAGLWRGNEAVGMVRRGEFALLVLRPVVEPRDLAEAVKESYRPVAKIPFPKDIGGWPYLEVYAPRRATGSRSDAVSR